MLVLLVVALVLYATDPGAAVLALLALGIVIPVALAVLFAFRARDGKRQLTEALDQAFLKVATELERAHGGIDAELVARTMRLDRDAAQELAAKVTVNSLLADASTSAWLSMDPDATRHRIAESTEISPAHPSVEGGLHMTKRPKS